MTNGRLMVFGSEQVAINVGPRKDSYYINVWAYINPETDQTTYKAEVEMNKYGDSKKVFEGTLKECEEYIQEILSRYTTYYIVDYHTQKPIPLWGGPFYNKAYAEKEYESRHRLASKGQVLDFCYKNPTHPDKSLHVTTE